MARWNVNRLSTLMTQVDAVLNEYIAQCIEAEDVAPDEWRGFWKDEAEYAAQVKKAMLHKIQMFVDYAAGRPVEMLGQREVRRVKNKAK